MYFFFVQGRIEHVVRVCVYIRILILKSRALTTITTITQRIERDVKKSGIMQLYSGTPGVKSNFRDYPGKSGRVGRSVCLSTTNIVLQATRRLMSDANSFSTTRA